MFNIDKIDNAKKNALIIRHAERFKIEEGQQGDDVNLTPFGFKTALEYGEYMQKFNVNKIYTSPVKRCVDTAKQISKGYNNSIVQVEQSSFLGSPSAYIKDENIAFKHMNDVSFYEGYLKLIKGENRPGFYSLSEGSTRLDNFFKLSTNKKGITLFITHDIIIAFFIFYKTQQIMSDENWINFLDGYNCIFDE